MSDADTVHTGKIGRCPPAIREEVCRRLHEGQSGRKICAWLNEQPEVLRVLDEYFREEPVTEQNLSEWRRGGYQKWLGRRAQIERTKELSGYAAQLAANGQGAAPGNVAIVGGQLLEIFESLDVDEQKALLKTKPSTYLALVGALAKLEKSQADRIKAEAGRDMVQIQRDRAEQAEQKLALEREKHQVRTCELFLKYAEDKRAREIIDGKADKQVKLDQLRLHFFPKPTADD